MAKIFNKINIHLYCALPSAKCTAGINTNVELLISQSSPGFTLQSTYLCTQPRNTQSRAVKYLAKNTYATLFRLLKSGFGKLTGYDGFLPQLLQKPAVLEMVLLRSCNLKIESQNGVQMNLSQESQLLSEPHSSSWCCITWPACLSSLVPERNKVFH